MSLRAWGRIEPEGSSPPIRFLRHNFAGKNSQGVFACIAQKEGKSPPLALVHVLPSRVVIFRQ